MTTLDRHGRIAAAVGLAALGGSLVAALLVGVSASGTGGMGGMGPMTGMGVMGGIGPLTFPFTVLSLLGALALGYAGIRAVAADDASGTAESGGSADLGDRRADDEDPVARLQRRYTEGELTEAAFERALERELEDGEADAGTDAEPERGEFSDPAFEGQ